MKLFQHGECEPLKVTVHAALGTLATTCLVYNAVAFAKRRESHLAVNTLLYGALSLVELHKVWRHRQAVK